jgi:hypothetical protein
MNLSKLIVLVCLAAVTALGSKVGDSYEQVLADNGNPKSQIDGGSIKILNYPPQSIKVKDGVVVSITIMPSPTKVPDSNAQAPTPSPEDKVAKAQKDLRDAIEKVKGIVNQPVAMVPRNFRMKVEALDSFFPDPATKPDFNTVDIKTTRRKDYDQFEFVCLKSNPTVVWVGKTLEFNPMTRYFYDDLSVPKKKLTDDDMDEIDRLYKIIGRCEAELRPLGIELPPPI